MKPNGRHALTAALVATLALAACQREEATAPATTAADTTAPAASTTPAPAAEPPAAVPATDTPRPDNAGAMATSGTGAVATLGPTEGQTANGRLLLTGDASGIRITGSIVGLAPNAEHGFHVHEKGDCSAADASSAGPHFNPFAAVHGKAESGVHHAGDIPNIVSDAQGNATVDVSVPGLTLGDGGPNDAMGKAIIVHEKRDDYATQPSGDSGARIACGTINAG